MRFICALKGLIASLVFLFFCLDCLAWQTSENNNNNPAYCTIDSAFASISLAPFLSILPASGIPVSIEEVRTKDDQLPFVPLIDFFEEKNNNKYPEHHAWLRMYLTSNIDYFSEWKLFPVTRNNVPDTVEVYIVKGDSVQKKQTGRMLPYSQIDVEGFSQVDFPRSFYGVTIGLNPNDSLEIFISYRHGSVHQFEAAPELESMHAFIGRSERNWFHRNLFQGFYQGMLAMFILFNLVIWWARRDPAYLYYAFYVLSIAVLCMGFERIRFHQVILPDHPILANFLDTVADNTAVIFYLLFLKTFLGISKLMPNWNRIINAILIFHISFLFLRLILFSNESYETILNNLNLCIILIIFSVFIVLFIKLIRSRSVLAKYIVVGSSFLLLGGSVHILELMGVIKLNFLSGFLKHSSVYIFQITTIMELITFSLGLGFRAKLIQKEKSIIKTKEEQRIQVFCRYFE